MVVLPGEGLQGIDTSGVLLPLALVTFEVGAQVGGDDVEVACDKKGGVDAAGVELMPHHQGQGPLEPEARPL